jgi:DNA-binding NarL/FixJ family response regulator
MRHILLLEDNADTRGWFSDLLAIAFGRVKIVPAGSIQEAADLIKRHLFSLAIVDIYLPDGRGIDFIRKLKQAQPGIFCVVVTAFDDTADIFDALKAGADGYLLKSQDRDNLVRLLREITEGAPPLSPSIARRIIKHFNAVEPRKEAKRPTSLTQREEEVLAQIAKGMTRNEIARLLGIRPGTVAGYIKRIYEKLDIASRAEAALEARRMGLV